VDLCSKREHGAVRFHAYARIVCVVPSDRDVDGPTRSVVQLMNDILDAIARTKVADKRLRLAHSLVDDIGVQLAYQAVLHNVSVIANAVNSLPAEYLDRSPGTPWSEIARLPEAYGDAYLRVNPEAIRRMVELDLDPLDVAVRRLRASQ
jgi:uncharacterized protein with HEPN domain